MLQPGSEEQFSILRDLFSRAGYDEAQLCQRFGIPSLDKFEEEFDRTQIRHSDDDVLGILIQLFVEGQYVDTGLAEQHFGSTATQTMADLGLIEHAPDDPLQIAATVALYPTAGVWIASDRWNQPDRSSYKPREDVVYPAIVSNAQRFLRFLPRTPCESFLDLCSGTAFTGLHAASQFADQIYACDITPRAAEFADFNRRLNGLGNVAVLTGDLYHPVEGKQFDRIAVHPPYVPVLRPKWIYHDGGEDGEQIIRRCVAGVPDHLKPGGLFYMLAMASDREDSLYEQRVRQWLGEKNEEFDIAVFVVRSLDPEEFAVRAVVNSENPSGDLREFKRLFRSLGIQQMTYAALMIQRRTEERPVFTVRRQNSSDAGLPEMMAAIEWETQMKSPDGIGKLLESHLHANRESDLRVRHALTDEGWEIAEYMLRTSWPFSMEAKTDPWAPFLIAQCDGTKTVAEHFQLLLDQEALPPGTDPAEFARALAILISGGFLQTERAAR